MSPHPQRSSVSIPFPVFLSSLPLGPDSGLFETANTSSPPTLRWLCLSLPCLSTLPSPSLIWCLWAPPFLSSSSFTSTQVVQVPTFTGEYTGSPETTVRTEVTLLLYRSTPSLLHVRPLPTATQKHKILVPTGDLPRKIPPSSTKSPEFRVDLPFHYRLQWEGVVDGLYQSPFQWCQGRWGGVPGRDGTAESGVTRGHPGWTLLVNHDLLRNLVGVVGYEASDRRRNM